MNVIDKNSLLSTQEMNLLTSHSRKTFSLGKFGSLDDILTSLNVDVVIVPGIKTRTIPTGLDDAEEYWRKEANRLECLIPKDSSKRDDYNKARKKADDVRNEKEQWSTMALRGLYDPTANQIQLFPDEMRQEFGGSYMNELLVSTLAHEVMHAYFNRPRHKNFPYVIFVEEPLAEFGMLLYLHETGSNYYKWAYQDVSSKRTCYRYGAKLMDHYQTEHLPSATRRYLEEYKIKLNNYQTPVINNGTITMPQRGSSTNIPVNGTTINPNWKNLFELPTYFWDENTQTLGLNGDWIEDLDYFIHEKMHLIEHYLCHSIKNLYIGDDFYMSDRLRINHLFHDLSECNIIISASNPHYQIINGIAMTRHNRVMPIYETCGKGHYAIPQNGKYGIFDSAGKQIVACKYDSIWSFDDNGLCMVRQDDAHGYRYGYVNEHGVEQIPVVYDHIYSFENGVTTAKKNGVYGIIDEHNNIVHPFDLHYPDMRGIRDGFATMRNEKGKWGTIDSKGNVVIPCQYDSLIVFGKDGTDEVSMNGEKFIIDTKGNRVK